jgi:hypothetical protein
MPPFSICNNCGEPARWAGRGDGRKILLTPLDIRYVVDAHNVARSVTTYDLHVCDEEKRVAHNEAMADEEMRREQVEQLRDMLWDAALKNECSKCSVAVGVRCENLSERARGRKVEVKWPHDERIPAPIRVEIYQTLDLAPPPGLG